MHFGEISSPCTSICGKESTVQFWLSRPLFSNMIYTYVVRNTHCKLKTLTFKCRGLYSFAQSKHSAPPPPRPLSKRCDQARQNHAAAAPTCPGVWVTNWQSIANRSISTHSRLKAKEDKNGERQVPVRRGAAPSPSATQKVKEAGRDFTYFIVVLVGIGVTGGLLYVVFKELFSSSSPSKIYGDALQKCRAHTEVIGFFGEPIKGYGETTRRGRRQHVRHIEYLKDGVKHMRLKFYIEGSEPRAQGTVHVEVKENPDSGKFEFRYIFIEVDTYPPRTIVIEDNR